MTITNYAFIVKGPGYDPNAHRSVIECPSFRTEVVCVSSVAEAISAARELVARGIEVIELCGGFGEACAVDLISHLGSSVPVGHVVFSKSESEKLAFVSQDKPAEQ